MGFHRYFILIALTWFFNLCEGQALLFPGTKKTGNIVNSQSKEITWKGNIEINEDIEIASDEILYIQPGTKVEMKGYYSINVYGSIIAKGNSNNMIIFTVGDTSGFTDYSSENGGWQGFSFMSGNSNYSRLEYVVIEYAKDIDLPANGEGGGIYSGYYSNLEINNSIIRNNYARLGGGIMAESADIVISHCFIYNNFATEGGGGIFCVRSAVSIYNNVVYGNKSYNGAGIYFQSCLHSELINNTICNNQAFFAGGGIFFNQQSDPDIINTVLYYNESGVTGDETGLISNSNPSFYNCNISGGKNKFALISNNQYTGNYLQNIDEVPVFKNPVLNDYSLVSTSPCIDIGDNHYVKFNFDIGEKRRIWDGDSLNGATVDIGAYEYGAMGRMMVKDSVKPVTMVSSFDGEIIVAVTAGIGPFNIYLYDEHNYYEYLYGVTQGEYKFEELDHGEYILNVYDSDGDIYRNNLTVGYFNQTKFSMNGTVKLEGSLFETGVVMAYKKTNNIYSAYDKAYLKGGHFEFANIDSASYLLYAVPDYNFNQNILPAYYLNAFKWEDAFEIDVVGQVGDIDINLFNKQEVSFGDNSVSGNVFYEGDIPDPALLNNWFPIDETPAEFGRAKNVLVLLYKDIHPYTWMLSKYDGSFEFFNLPGGNYSVVAQYPGYEMVNNPAFELSGNKSIRDIKIIIKPYKIFVVYPGSEVQETDIHIYPNPFKDHIEIVIPDYNELKFNFSLYDITGRKLFGQVKITKPELEDKISIQLDYLSQGIYRGIIELNNIEKGFTLIKTGNGQ